jgi:hypothetical protein
MALKNIFPIIAYFFALHGHGQATYDARIVQYIGTEYVCDGSVEPILKIINNGSATMFGCVVETWKNGLVAGSFDWQLGVPALQGQVRAPSFPSVAATTGDVLEFRIISVNGIADEVEDGNILEVPIDDEPFFAPSATVLIEVLTDDAPEQTTWVLRNASGQVQASGGPYDDPGSVYEHWLELSTSGCYLLDVIDAAGDGLASGHFRMYSASEEVLSVDGPTSFTERTEGFTTGVVSSIMGHDRDKQLTLFPVPATGPVFIECTALPQGSAVLEIMDATGRSISSSRITVRNGRHLIDTSSLRTGSYQVVIYTAIGDRYRSTMVLVH